VQRVEFGQLRAKSCAAALPTSAQCIEIGHAEEHVQLVGVPGQTLVARLGIAGGKCVWS
jgi:hypothetical protein